MASLGNHETEVAAGDYTGAAVHRNDHLSGVHTELWRCCAVVMLRCGDAAVALRASVAKEHRSTVTPSDPRPVQNVFLQDLPIPRMASGRGRMSLKQIRDERSSPHGGRTVRNQARAYRPTCNGGDEG